MSHSGRGRGSTHPPNRGTHQAELARSNRQHAQAQASLGFASPHIKPLVGGVMTVDKSTDDATHAVFSKICIRNQWRFHSDVRGDFLGRAHTAKCGIPVVYSEDSQLLCLLRMMMCLVPFQIPFSR